MDALQIVYAIVLVTSVLSQSAFVVYIWRRRSVPSAQRFFWFALTTAFTSLTYLGLATAPNPSVGYLWAKLRFLGTALLSVHYMLFVLAYTGHDGWMRPSRYFWLYIIPLITQVSVWTNSHHHAFFTTWHLESRGGLSAEVATFGWLYWVHVVYAYVLIVAAFGTLWTSVHQAKGIFKRQMLFIFIGSVITVSVSLPDAFHLTEAPFNSFPIASILVVIYFAWALFRYGLLDLVPVAHETIFHSLTDMALVLDRQNRIVDINPAALRMVGKADNEVIGQSVAAVFASWPALVEVLQDAHHTHTEIMLDAATHLELYPSFLRDHAGEPSGCVILLRNINERKEAESSLAAHNRVLRLLHDMAVEIGTELDFEVLLQHMLERAVELLDADRGGAIHIYDEDADELRMEAGTVINSDRIHTVVKRGSGVTGRVFESAEPLIVNDYTHWEGRTIVLVASPPSAVMGIPLLIQGRVLGVLSVAADSSRRTFGQQDVQVATMFAAQAATAIQNVRSYQRAQHELEERGRAEESLQASEAMLRALLDAQTESVFLMDTVGIILAANEAAAARLGRTLNAIIETNVFDLMPSDVRQARFKYVQAVLANCEPIRFEDQRAGMWFENVLYPVFEGEGEDRRITRMAVVARDITEQKKAEQQQISLAIEREKVKLLADFITLAAHEFRTPLSTINMNLALAERVQDAESLSKRLSIVRQQLTYIANLIDTMLRMTQMDSKTQLTLTPTNVDMLFRDLETRFWPAIEAQAATLVVDLAPDLPPVLGNAPILYEALTHLLTNALHHTTAGGTITLRAYGEPEAVVIEVVDTGEGISEEHLPHIFERFYRVDEARSTRGAGLGLSIVKRAVELHFGTVDVESVVNQGSTFRLRLPRDD